VLRSGNLAYTSVMNRFIVASLGLSLFLPGIAVAQVRITASAQHYGLQEEIHASVENIGNRAVTFCVEFAQTSPRGDEIESAPSPFWIRRKRSDKWSTLITGPDAGSTRAAVVLEVGESKDFPFRINDGGMLRLRLNYWYGSTPNMDCHAPPKDVKLATSKTFLALPLEYSPRQ
jgi:hypothetical protein